MTTEEKAKAYGKALEWMRKVYPTLTGADKEDVEYYFPELKESEDEKMIGVIRLALTDVPEERFTTEGTSLSKVLDWLEKQKENGFDAFMDGFNKGYELGMKEQTKNQ